MKHPDRDEYPLFKPGHSTSTLLVCMFLAFTIGFITCHELYAGLGKRFDNLPKLDYNDYQE